MTLLFLSCDALGKMDATVVQAGPPTPCKTDLRGEHSEYHFEGHRLFHEHASLSYPLPSQIWASLLPAEARSATPADKRAYTYRPPWRYPWVERDLTTLP